MLEQRNDRYKAYIKSRYMRLSKNSPKKVQTRFSCAGGSSWASVFVGKQIKYTPAVWITD